MQLFFAGREDERAGSATTTGAFAHAEAGVRGVDATLQEEDQIAILLMIGWWDEKTIVPESDRRFRRKGLARTTTARERRSGVAKGRAVAETNHGEIESTTRKAEGKIHLNFG